MIPHPMHIDIKHRIFHRLLLKNPITSIYEEIKSQKCQVFYDITNMWHVSCLRDNNIKKLAHEVHVKA